MSRPLAVDLFCGLGGWTDGLLAEGWDVIGFDIEQHVYGEHRYPAQLVIQDVLTLHGSQFRDADLIVASPPCQEYSYMAMPWSKAKAKAAAIKADNACFRIQREACEAAGRHIPLIVENVKGAQPWVGRARWAYGSFFLWGDVPALMPIQRYHQRLKVRAGEQWNVNRANFTGTQGWDDGIKNPGFRFDGSGCSFQSESVKNSGGSWFNVAHNTTSGKGNNPDGRKTDGVKQRGSGHAWFDKALDERRKNPDGRKVGGDWFGSGNDRSMMRQHHSKSTKRKFASATIAKIPLPLSRWIAATFYPARAERAAA